MIRVGASIQVLHWPARRARLDDEDLSLHFRRWALWLAGKAPPSLHQLEDFARLTHSIGYARQRFLIPTGYFFAPPQGAVS